MLSLKYFALFTFAVNQSKSANKYTMLEKSCTETFLLTLSVKFFPFVLEIIKKLTIYEKLFINRMESGE